MLRNDGRKGLKVMIFRNWALYFYQNRIVHMRWHTVFPNLSGGDPGLLISVAFCDRKPSAECTCHVFRNKTVVKLREQHRQMLQETPQTDCSFNFELILLLPIRNLFLLPVSLQPHLRSWPTVSRSRVLQGQLTYEESPLMMKLELMRIF